MPSHPVDAEAVWPILPRCVVVHKGKDIKHELHGVVGRLGHMAQHLTIEEERHAIRGSLGRVVMPVGHIERDERVGEVGP